MAVKTKQVKITSRLPAEAPDVHLTKKPRGKKPRANLRRELKHNPFADALRHLVIKEAK